MKPKPGGSPSQGRALAVRKLAVPIFSLLIVCLAAAPAVAAAAQGDVPVPTGDSGKSPASASREISIARATWDTGWFQTEVFRLLLEELGYEVGEAKTMGNLEFYQAAADGQVDLWANGWFPLHDGYLAREDVKGRVEAVGFEVKAGALQGYMVDAKTARAYRLETLGDLKSPLVAPLFDRDGDGKADLIGCNPGWGCAEVVESHLDLFDLRDYVEHVQGDYSPMMAEAVGRYRRGKPVLFYTWTPNWTTGALIPGRDAVWLQVPFSRLPGGDGQLEENTSVHEIPGCPDDPCAMGFEPNDIRAVANGEFLGKRPDVRRLLELVEIPLEDISEQNARMIGGEDDSYDIRRHAAEWIRDNRARIDRWLKSAKSLRVREHLAGDGEAEAEAPSSDRVLRVVTKRFEPFVVYENLRYRGFSIELWEQIARRLGLRYELYGVNTLAKMLDDVRRGAADVAIAGIGITSRREMELDFSHPYFESGLQILVPVGSDSQISSMLSKIMAILLSEELLYSVGLFLVVLVAVSHIIWFLERNRNPQFSGRYTRGLWQSIWWAVVTVTTVGYGDKTPKGVSGRLFGVFWILSGYFVFAYFTASVTSTVTVRELHGAINGPEDLYGKKVATVKKSTAAEYLREQGISASMVPNVEEAYGLLESGKADALVYDAPVLQHYAAGSEKVAVVGLVFREQSYGIALRIGSPFREKINVALLKLVEDGTYDRIHHKWFGS